MPRLEVVGLGTAQAAIGQTLLEACEQAGIPIETECGGFAACNSCRVLVLAGELGPTGDEELPFLDLPEHRLGCQARVVGDVMVKLDPGL
jgi:2Fe-2S ferredoxin